MTQKYILKQLLMYVVIKFSAREDPITPNKGKEHTHHNQFVAQFGAQRG